MMRIAAFAIPVLLLASCAPDAPDAAPMAEPADQTASAPVTDTAATPPPGSEADGRIPARYLGVWDHEKGDCNPASDMRMEIAPRQITYYESVGLVTGVGDENGDALVDLAMEGEGEEWFQSSRLSLSADGSRLEVTDALKPKVPDEFPRKRCATQGE